MLERGKSIVNLVLLLSLVSVSLLGCSAESPSSLRPASPGAAMISELFFVIFWVAVAVFVIVEALLLYSVIRFRRKSEDEMPRQIHGDAKLEIAWTAAPAAVLAIVFVLTYQTLMALAEHPQGALEVRVKGHQWWWEVEYPGLGVVTANEIHLPVMQPARFTVESKDVIHSFWVPELGGKIDLIPGKANVTSFLPNQTGTFRGQCAEFCGDVHADMRFVVVVESKADFDAWVARQKTPAVSPTDELAKRGEREFAVCAACHTVVGTNAKGVVGPDLTHFGSRKTLGAGILDNNTSNLRAWVFDPQSLKPGNKMPALRPNQQQLDALIAYLQSLK